MTTNKWGVGWRLLVAGTVGVGLVSGGLVGAGAANASPTVLVQHVYNTGGEGLWMHPSSPTLDSALSVVVPESAEFGVQCWTAGDNVNGDNVWLYGTATATGDTGYLADFYVDTATTQGSEGAQLSSQGVPQCGAEQPAAAAATVTPTSDHTMDLSTPCQGSQWVNDLVVIPLPGNNFKIEITPTPELRNPVHANDRNITVDIWHDIQSCVPGLYGDLADSIWQQLQCHQELAVIPDKQLDGWATGPTFDFESWHPKLPNPGIGTYVSTHCLNELGTDPGPATGNAVRPGEGILDLDFGNYA